MTKHYLYEPYQPMIKAVWGPGNYYAPRPPVVTSASGSVTILCVDGGARLFDDSGHTAECSPGSLPASQELVGLLSSSQQAIDGFIFPDDLDGIAKDALVLPRGAQWRDALRTALVGSWSDALYDTGYLPATALGALKAHARKEHRQQVPLWRRRTRHGRVLSLDAELGDGLSLYDLVVVDIDLLSRVAGGVFEDERLNAVLRGLDPAEQLVVFAYAEGEGTTWAEAATHVGATDPKAFGERVRRRAKRLAGEQHRRAALRSGNHGEASL